MDSIVACDSCDYNYKPAIVNLKLFVNKYEETALIITIRCNDLCQRLSFGFYLPKKESLNNNFIFYNRNSKQIKNGIFVIETDNGDYNVLGNKIK